MKKQKRKSSSYSGNTKQARITPKTACTDIEMSEMNLSQERNFDISEVSSPDMLGRLERIHLKNFMCHENLDFEFDQYINFIVGRNGSGKSAIMTALIVGLGGKASITGRASSIKGFIKTGKQTAEVAITLCNSGRFSYNTSEYGKSVTICRKFTQDGGSSYQLKNAQGRVVSTKYSELLNILEHFKIQVDNPVVILNQDASKHFLNSKNPRDKYKFFLKATALEEILNLYQSAGTYRDKSIKIVAEKEKVLPMLLTDVRKLEHRFKSLQSLNQQRQKIVDLTAKLAWSYITLKEIEGEKMKKVLDSYESRLPKFESAVTEHEEKVAAVTDEQAAAVEEHRGVVEEQTASVSSLQASRNEVRERKDALRLVLTDIKKAECDLTNHKRDYEDIRAKIEEIKNTQQHDYEAERRARNEKVASLEAARDEKLCQLDTRQHDIDQFQAEVSRLRTEIAKLESDGKAYSQQLRKMVDERNELENSRSNRLNRFGAGMPRVVQTIDEVYRRNGFHKKPRGPIGACIKLRDYKWALAVETCIKGFLFSFCVHDHHDFQVLTRIFQNSSLARHPSIITSKYQDAVHDVSRFKPALSQFPTVLDIIDSDDPVVLNTLIDQRMIENIVLIEDEDTAVKIMRTSQPRNVKEVFTLQGSMLFCRPTFRFYSGQHSRAQYLTANVDDTISALDAHTATIRMNMSQIKNARDCFVGEMKTNDTKRRTAESQLNKLTAQVHQLNYEISELKNVENPIPVDVQTLEEDLYELSEKMETLNQTLVRLEERRLHEAAAFEESDNARKMLVQQIRVVEEREALIKSKKNDIACRLSEAKSLLKHYEKKKVDLMEDIRKSRKALDVFQAELDADLARVMVNNPTRLHDSRMPGHIQAEIKQIEVHINTQQDIHGDIEEIREEMLKKQESYKAIRKLIKNMKNFIARLSEGLRLRQEVFMQLRQHIEIRVRFHFSEVLRQRNFTGEIIMNHEDGTLTMKITPKEGLANTTQQVQSLSGGERSFTTISFILALWHVMQSPFRALDEFDVFMDMVNRKVSLEMLVEKARESRKQFVLLTPQNMSSLTDMQDITVLRMQDPQRHH